MGSGRAFFSIVFAGLSLYVIGGNGGGIGTDEEGGGGGGGGGGIDTVVKPEGNGGGGGGGGINIVFESVGNGGGGGGECIISSFALFREELDVVSNSRAVFGVPLAVLGT